MQTSDSRRLRWLLGGSLLAAFALHCGGGGIGGTGSVSGFGSVFVNGIEWFTDSAEITLDGVAATEADLRLGMIVDLDGQPLGATTAVAVSIHFDDTIQGPVAGLAGSGATRELEILDQTVWLHAGQTVFDDSSPGFGFDTVAIDDVLEVSGHVDGAGEIHATWVRRLGGVVLGQTAVELEGDVSAWSGGSFQIGGVLIQVDAGTDLSELSSPLAEGLPVEVEGILLAANEVQATRVADQDGFPVSIPEFSLEGLISDFVSLADFRVAGQPVDASQAELEPADPAAFADGVLVEVEGPIVDGLLIAEKLVVQSVEVKIRAEIAASEDVDSLGMSLVLLGVDVAVDPDTELQDDRDGLPGFGLADLDAGDFVEVKGLSVGAGALLASELRRDEAGDVVLRGPVGAFDESAQALAVCGVPVDVDGSTAFFDAAGSPLSSSEFFQALRPWRGVRVVDQSDSDDPEVDVADEAHLEE